MSYEITTAMVEQYKSNVQLISQQKGSRFRGIVRNDSLTGRVSFYETLGLAAAQLKTSRRMDTPLSDTPHGRRAVFANPYVWADTLDSEDKVRTLIDPLSPYVTAAVNAFGRSIDDVVIAAANGTAYTGVNGTTAVALPSTQKIAAGGTGLTVEKLIEARGILWDNEVDESIPLHIAVGNMQLQNLLALEKVTSADYASIKALVQGDIDTFMGFKFHRTERLAVDSNDIRDCLAWAEDGILLGLQEDIHTRISERDDKNYMVQVWCSMDIGATRMEEEKVVEIKCDESP